MGLLDTLKAVKEEGFNPKTDKINGGGGLLGSGIYPVMLTSSDLGATKNGHEQVVITLTVVSGDDKDRKEMLFLSFYDELPDFIKEKNAKILMKLAEYTGVQFSNKDLADEMAAADALKNGIGKQFKMDLKVVANKKNPDYPYRNYDFDSLEVSAAEEELMDLPF